MYNPCFKVDIIFNKCLFCLCCCNWRRISLSCMSLFFGFYVIKFNKSYHKWFLCVLVLCTQVNMMFVMLLWVCIHTGQAKKFAWPQLESNHSGNEMVSQRSRVRFPPWSGKLFSLLSVDAHLVITKLFMHPLIDPALVSAADVYGISFSTTTDGP
jgi:hypothetical protein